MAESKEEEPLVKSERGEWKNWLKNSIFRKPRSWHHFLQIDGEIMETVTDFIFLDSKIIADGDWSHEIKRFLFLWRKVMINLDSILKNRDITLPSKVCLVKAMVFPAVMYGCEHWTIKKAESWRTDALKLWCWRGLLRVPWTARRSTQSILKEISLWKDWCWSWNSNNFATWCEEQTHLKRPWCWERLKVGGEGDDRGWDGWMASPTQWTWVWVASRSGWWTGKPGVLQSMGLQRAGHDWVTEQQLKKRTETNKWCCCCCCC